MSSGCMGAFVWDFEGFHMVSKAPNGVPGASSKYELPPVKGRVLQTLLHCNAREDGWVGISTRSTSL